MTISRSAVVIIGALSIVVGALAGAAALGTTDSQGFVRITPEEIKWERTEDGLQRATIEGDPSKPGIYVIRVKFTPGVMSRPHYHREDRLAVVLKGTWYTGTGDQFAPDKTVGLKPGSFMKHPAGAHHYDGAKDEEVIVQIVGYGPSTTTQVKP
jgi:quercetin dioxygenase-like cupin family protein